MGRPIALSADALVRVLYASQLIALVLALLFVATPLDGVGRLAVAVLFASLASVAAVGPWRTTTDGGGRSRLDTAEDLTDDPFADPGQAARERWERAILRLPGEDDERD